MVSMEKFSKKRVLSLSEQAYQAIKDIIIRGQIVQGEVLSILYLSELLNIGRTPVSIACQRLECEGLVRIIPKQGVLISTMSMDDVRELYESRVAIEIFMADRAFENLNEKDVATLEQSLERQSLSIKNADSYGFMEEDTFFHRFILEHYNNKTLMDMHHRLSDRIFLFGVKNSKNPTRLQQSFQEHQEILNSIKSGDKATFLKVLQANIIHGYLFQSALYLD